MPDVSASILIGVVAWVGYQVLALRREARQHHIEVLNARRRTELDAELRRLCPNVCTPLDIMDLREWQAIMDIENEYTINGRKSIGELQRRIKLHLEPAFRGRRMSSITTADVRASPAPDLRRRPRRGKSTASSPFRDNSGDKIQNRAGQAFQESVKY